MKKPKHLELLEKFNNMLKSNGYELEIYQINYSNSYTMRITFPDKTQLEIDGDEIGDFKSSRFFVFNQMCYNTYIENNKMTGNNLSPPNPDNYWEAQEDG